MMRIKERFFGWGAISHSILSFILVNFFAANSLNIAFPAIAELRGFDYSNLLYFNTIGGFVGILVTLISRAAIQKVGVKLVIFVGALISGIAFILMPLCTSQSVCGLLVIINAFTVVMYNSTTAFTLIGNWFPRKKGFVLGLVTGAGAISALVLLPIFSNLNDSVGIVKAMLCFGVLQIAFAVSTLFWIKNTPAEAGLYPDNMPMTAEEEARFVGQTGEKSPWSVTRVLKNKRFLLYSIGWGLSATCLIGIMTSAMPIMLSKGASQATVLAVVSSSGIIGFAGSTLSGVTDTKFGTVNTSVVTLALQALGALIMGIAGQGQVALMLAGYVALVSVSQTSNNLLSSQLITVAGARHFNAVFGVAWAIIYGLRALGSTICGWSLSNFGDYTPALYIFVALSVLALILVRLVGTEPEPVPED